MLRPNHAWNAVKINNEWRLIDPTWAAGSVDNRDEDKLKYYKNFNECYYFTPPDKLILNHFPRQNRFQLVPKIVHEMDFKKAPLFTSVYLSDSIKKVFPDTALIKGKSGDTLIIKFKTNAEPGKMCAWSDILQKATHSGYAVRKDEWIEYHYPIQATGFYNLYIGYYDNRHAVPLIAYKMEIK